MTEEREERSKKYEVRARIQQNIGGFNIDDIVQGELDKKAREKKERTDAERLRNLQKAKNKTTEVGAQEIEDTATQSERKYDLSETTNSYVVIVHTDTVQQAIRYNFSKEPLDGGDKKRFMDWERYAGIARKIKVLEPATSTEIHILASACYENRTGPQEEVSERIRDYLEEMFRQGIFGLTSIEYLEGESTICHHTGKDNTPMYVHAPDSRGESGLINSVLNAKEFLSATIQDDNIGRVLNVYGHIVKAPTGIIRPRKGIITESPVLFRSTRKDNESNVTGMMFINALLDAEDQKSKKYQVIGVQEVQMVEL